MHDEIKKAYRRRDGSLFVIAERDLRLTKLGA